MSYSQHKSNRSSSSQRYGITRAGGPHEQSFCCINCRIEVSCDPIIAGVQNRNHCPYCLWSRHMDLHVAGDRLARCRRGMQPLGLTVKRVKDKYGIDRAGELMLIHRCVACDKRSINRIAGDDHPRSLLEVYESSLGLAEATLAQLAESEIRILLAGDDELVRARIYGYGRALETGTHQGG